MPAQGITEHRDVNWTQTHSSGAPEADPDRWSNSPTSVLGIGSIRDSAYLPDSDVAALAVPSGIFTVDIRSGKLIDHIPFVDGFEPRSIDIISSPTPAYVVFDGDTRARVIDRSTGSILTDWTFDTPLEDMAISPDGKKVIIAYSRYTDPDTDDTEPGHVDIFGYSQGSPLPSTPLRSYELTNERSHVVWSPDGSYYVYSDGADIYVYTDLNIRKQAIDAESTVTSMEFSADVRYIGVTTTGAKALLYDGTNFAEQRRFDMDGAGTAIGFDTDSRMVIAGDDSGFISIFDIQTSGRDLYAEVYGEWSDVSSVAFSPRDGLVHATNLDGTIFPWSKSNNIFTARDSIKGHNTTATGIEWGDHGIYTVAGFPKESHGLLRVWDPSTKDLEQTIETGKPRDLAYSDKGDRLGVCSESAVSGQGTITIFNVDEGTGEVKNATGVHDEACRAIVFDSTGDRMAAGMADGTILVMDHVDGSWVVTMELPAHGGRPVTRIALSMDGSLVVTGSTSGEVIVWDIESEFEEQVLVSGGSPVVGLDWSPDGGSIAYSKQFNQDITLVNTQNWYEEGFIDLDDDVVDIRFSTGGGHIAILDEAGWIFTQEIATGIRDFGVLFEEDTLQNVEWATTGDGLIVSTDQHSVFTFGNPPGESVFGDIRHQGNSVNGGDDTLSSTSAFFTNYPQLIYYAPILILLILLIVMGVVVSRRRSPHEHGYGRRRADRFQDDNGYDGEYDEGYDDDRFDDGEMDDETAIFDITCPSCLNIFAAELVPGEECEGQCPRCDTMFDIDAPMVT